MSKRDWGELAFTLLVAFSVVFIIFIMVLVAINTVKVECTESSFECRHYHVEKCLKSELYSRDECIQLVGSGGTQ